jgi:hypothetical protein
MADAAFTIRNVRDGSLLPIVVAGMLTKGYAAVFF